MNSSRRLARDLVTSLADALLAITLAPDCAACGRVLERPSEGAVCSMCWSAIPTLIPPLCPGCGGMLASWRVEGDAITRCRDCGRRPSSAIALTRTVGPYDGALKNIIHAFKYEGRRTLATPLGALMHEAARELVEDASCIVPVPLHPWRRFRRGFNQAADLAHGLHRPVLHALWRYRATPPQTALTAAGRRRNVRNAFVLSPLVSRRTRESLLIEKVVILVDDVRTTGATLDSCATVLKNAGARAVRALTIARAELPSRRVQSTGSALRPTRSP